MRFNATLENGKAETFEAECLLVAVGRKPNTENIGLEGTRVELDRGFVKVDEMQRTGEPGVYAIGDIVAGHPAVGPCGHRRRHGRHRAHCRKSR